MSRKKQTAASCYYGIGRHSYYVSAEHAKTANYYSFVGQPICIWSLGFAKMSMACMLLRIKHTKTWMYGLYALILLVVLAGVISNIAEFIQCRPLAAMWDVAVAMKPTTKCIDAAVIQKIAYATTGGFFSLSGRFHCPGDEFLLTWGGTAMNILSDIVLSLMPISFLKNMNRPLREKVALSCLMGLGIFATVAAILKTTVLNAYRSTRDPFWEVVDLSLWWQMEQNISIMAACIPTLKAPFERILGRLGLLTSLKKRTTRGYTQYGDGNSHPLSSIRTDINAEKKIAQSREAGASEDSILRMERGAYEAGASTDSRKIMNITRTTEVQYTTEPVQEADALEWGGAKNSGRLW